jgi:hypothetical protein
MPAALARHLIHYYSADAPLITNFVGGMAPSTLRRCIALMKARLEGVLRFTKEHVPWQFPDIEQWSGSSRQFRFLIGMSAPGRYCREYDAHR